jgi:branched-chain amino acid transport system ATP-binding protein
MATLNIQALTVKFGGVTAVRDVSFSADSERILGLIGPNGAGKSTLFNSICGIIKPTSGSITLDGSELAGRPTHRIAACGIGRVFQHPELVPHFTVLENLLLGCHRDFSYGLFSEIFCLPFARRQEAAARDRAAAVLTEVGLEGEMQQIAARLPYGHRKLIELARSLLSARKFLLLDEPVAGLNEAEIDRMAQTVLAVSRRRRLGVILVEHNMGLVSQLCDDLVVLDLGAVIARGSPATVLKNPAVMVAYLGEAA